MNKKDIQRDIEFRNLINNNRYKKCMFDDKECSEKIIKAHSIQNNRILNCISTNGKVCMINTRNLSSIKNSNYRMNKIGRKIATTFNGFCKYHDRKIFEPIELYDYELNNQEQQYIFADRAFAKECCDKKSVLGAFRYLLKKFIERDIDYLGKFYPREKINGDSFNYMINTFLPANIDGLESALKRYEGRKKSMKINIKNKKYHHLITEVIEFNEYFPIAVSSLINIKYDLNGKIINDMENRRAIITPIYLTVFPQNKKTYILLSYNRKHKSDYDFISNIKGMSSKKIKNIITNIIAMYCGNFVINPNYWDNMNYQTRKEFLDVFSGTIYNKHNLDSSRINIFVQTSFNIIFPPS